MLPFFRQKQPEQPDVQKLQDNDNMTKIAAGSLYRDPNFLEIVQFYTEPGNDIPINLKKENWAIFHKSLPLTFLENKEDGIIIASDATIAKIDELINTPPYLHNWHKSKEINQMKLFFWTNARRAQGAKKDIMNERTLQETQIAQVITSRKEEEKKKGLFGWG